MRLAHLFRPSLLGCILFGLLGCHGKGEENTARALVDTSRANAAISAPAWLHDRLPSDTIAYLRIPSPWALASAPDGRMLDPLLASEAHANMVEQIRTSIATDPGIAKTGMQPVLRLLFDGLASPLEIAALGSGKVASPASQVLITARLRYADVAALNAALQSVSDTMPLLSKPFDASGAGELSIAGQVLPAHYDIAHQRLFVLGGMAAAPLALQNFIGQTASVHASAMQPLEVRIDQGGQGLFAWFDIGALRSAAAMALNDPSRQSARDALAQVRGVAFGFGQVGGNGRISLLVDAPAAKLLRYLPRASKQSALRSAGEPRWAAVLALPTAQEWTDLHAAISDDFGADAAANLSDLEKQMKAKLGFDIADVLAAVGPELQFVDDDAGSYASLRLRDAAKFEALIKQLASAMHGSYETRDIGGTPFHSLAVPGIALLDKDSSASNAPDAWRAIYARLGYHYYWLEQEGNLLLSQIPQTLMDYRGAKTRTELDHWLAQVQGIDAAQSLFALTTKTHDTQRSAYAAYLGLLQLLGDAAGAKLDMYTLPSADALHLPREGLLGMQVHASADDIGLDLIYQQTPLEMFGSSSAAGVAVVAMAAAVALPAYQDYTVKARVATAYAAATAMQQGVSGYYAAHHKMPRSQDDFVLAAGVTDATYASDIYSLSYMDNQIAVSLNSRVGEQDEAKVFVLSAYRGKDGTLLWQCGKAEPPSDAKALGQDSREGTDMDEKYLPAACRP